MVVIPKHLHYKGDKETKENWENHSSLCSLDVMEEKKQLVRMQRRTQELKTTGTPYLNVGTSKTFNDY
ncbi:hypothetical protein KY290_036787 [Solanum tuberosum]|uniref:Uncharacterized protein n=1 Tax=Solanum tuberosum TaxID=4113 RepID=A0ABQ7TTP7_SOLTU|nr:hypothetical protein KY284_036173 [Solanum tuberosum]KAH0636355.1 hypothetical protein KY289_036270 [Solanum tuberosum]KAH0639521.1 hypothetical protein KY285_036107 [Solanum tuberosum]KAH0738082.1 hypothetical protein KY290_036787 [Solanum tuberosum]